MAYPGNYQSQGNYPPQQGNYPPQQGSYPPHQDSYGQYPPQQGGQYPSQQGGQYPPQPGGYGGPPQGQYPSSQGSGYAGQPGGYGGGQHGGYPPGGQQGGYPAGGQQGGYPGQAPPLHQGGYGGPPMGGPPVSAPPMGGPVSWYTSSIPPLHSAQVQGDVDRLHQAMRGIGTRESELIAVLGSRPPLHIQQVAIAYQGAYGRDLRSQVESETSGRFREVLVGCLTPLPEFDAKWLRKAIEGLGTDEALLTEILVGRTNQEIHDIKLAYNALYRRDAVRDVQSEVSGDAKHLLTALLAGARDESGQVLDPMADVEALYRAGEKRLGTDESTFIRILCSRSDRHLQAVFAGYVQRTGHTLEKAIKREFSGDMERVLLGMYALFTDRPGYIASLFEKSMHGLGTDDDMLVRLAVRHHDPNLMSLIKQAYLHRYGKQLYNRVSGETSGDYRAILLALIGK
ncbi:hypothetical protein CXG81DRAFT_15258 [Caulochytrium protostelioides]|uniref:Annexin n=1 Tax=Caulochytrium protostelioides TaxID=1555241 RepID=A0A4P9WV40_9FUNG|nr:Annexin [Caulochytrium protostelioides]RKO98935.1 hypothetical protein CXG81DRAFT_15258 [Caulochytrium protostelioides]|eukprot:RKO98935.1 hypothetical protein CXG81DRAFT_15258 [Caulochytrium protostelioides]